MLKALPTLFLLVLCWAPFSVAITPEKVGLYLSFEQRLAMTYSLIAQGQEDAQKHDVLARAKAYFGAAFKQEKQTVHVKNFAEFLRLYRGSWPDTQSVELDLKIIEERGVRPLMRFASESSRVQKQIESYLKWQASELISLASSDRDLVKYLASQKTPTTNISEILSWGDFGRELEALGLSWSDAILTEKMKELDRVGERIAESKMALKSDPMMRIFLQTMFTQYFSRLSTASKKLIISSYLGSNLNMSDLKKFELMVQNSGPQLQKLLQVVARQADVPEEMLEVFRQLENSVRPVPWIQVEQLLQKEKTNYDFRYFERKPLGVGTMAQVHRAKILIDGISEDVVVRFIKPGIAERIEEDKNILFAVAAILDENPEFRQTGAPKLTPIIQDITDTVIAELSPEDTIARQKIAMLYYEQETFLYTPEYKNVLKFHVPRVYEATGETAFMVQEMVIGRKLDKEIAMYAELASDLKREIVEQLARMWAYEVILGSGFYHSDLHQGNFMVRITEPAVTLNNLDYGMGGVISKELQRQFMLLGAGVGISSADVIDQVFWEISDKDNNTLTRDELSHLVSSKVAEIKKGLVENLPVEKWTVLVMDAGLKLPYEFVSLNRGLVIIDKLLSDAKSPLSVSDIMKTLGYENPLKIYMALVWDGQLSHKDFIKLGWMQLKDMMSSDEPSPSENTPPVRCESVF